MLKFLEKLKYPAMLLAFGFLLIVAGYFEIKDITKFQITVSAKPVYTIFGVGILFCVASVVLFMIDEITFGWIKPTKIKNLPNGYSVHLNQSEIRIIYGRLELLAQSAGSSFVVLPANEFFDDECIYDERSALGAYVSSKFTNQAKDIQKLIFDELKCIRPEKVEKEKGVIQDSYGIGTGVYLKNPLSSDQAILFLSVTTKRAGEGLRSEMSYIFQAMSEVRRIAADKRMGAVFIPIISSGHGGIKREVALFGMLLAICDAVTRSYGHHISDYNIVIFQKDAAAKPDVSKTIAKRLLKMAVGMHV